MLSSFSRAATALGTSPLTSAGHAVPPSATRICAAGRGGVIVFSGRSPAIQVGGAPSKDPSDARAMFVVLASIRSSWLMSQPRRSEPSTRPASSLRVLLKPASFPGTPEAATAMLRWPRPNTKSPPGPNSTSPDVDLRASVPVTSVDTFSGWVWYAIMPGSSAGWDRLFDIFLVICSAYCSKPFP